VTQPPSAHSDYIETMPGLRGAAEREAQRYREALEQIKRVAAIEAPPVSDGVPAKVWRIAYDALDQQHLPTEDT
jgi:hypothetical protein